MTTAATARRRPPPPTTPQRRRQQRRQQLSVAYVLLPAQRRLLVDERLHRLAADPEAGCTYDPTTAWWMATYGDGTGLMMFANSARHRRLVVLRILDLS